MQSILIFVVSFPHGDKRSHLKRRDQYGNADGKLVRRLPCTWLLEDWFTRLVGPDPEKQVRACKGRGVHEAHCIVRVRPGKVNEGELTNWNDEERLLMHYASCPKDAFSLVVVDFAVIESPWQIHVQQSGIRFTLQDGLSILSEPCLVVVVMHHGVRRTVREQCGFWAIPIPDLAYSCISDCTFGLRRQMDTPPLALEPTMQERVSAHGVSTGGLATTLGAASFPRSPRFV